MPPKSNHRPHRRLGDADLRLLRFAAEHHVIVAAQAAVLLGVRQSTARSRLTRLRGLGLLGACGSPVPWTRLDRITARGLRAIASPLSPPRAQTQSPRHDLGLGWLWLAARAGAFGPLAQLHSERSIRAAEGRPVAVGERGDDAPLLAVRPVGSARGGFGSASVAFAHIPDLVAVSAGGRRIAFELELSPKRAGRLEQILMAYIGDRRYDLVVYLTDDPRILLGVRTAARRLGCEGIVRVAQVRMPGALDRRGVGGRVGERRAAIER
jgi:hypothetical protein